ncbi:MAG: nucleoside-diphosphate sugar epimerase/dehydratase [Balneolaceae bacterium]|nr:nucleoside-diphosphate sugar epimerase/dehydratase [Balneolaceae bacterium]
MDNESTKKNNKYINRVTRGLFFLVGDSFSLLVSATIAYITLSPLSPVERPFPVELTLSVMISVLAGLGIFKMYMVNWKHLSLRDLARMIAGIAFGGMISLAVAGSQIELGKYEYAYTALLLINAVLLIGGFRISKRFYFEIFNTSRRKTKKHTIIYGAESEGEQILRDILKNGQWNLAIYGIFDDRVMPGMLLHGIRVMGGREEMMDHLSVYPVDLLIVAFPDLPKQELKSMIEQVKEIRPELEIKILPSFHSLTDDAVGIQHIRDVSIEDILGREPVKLDMNSIEQSIRGKTVLVTGAGGSIGSELVRQCVKLSPGKLIALDIDETELFHINNEFKDEKVGIIPCVASITDDQKINQILELHNPDVIFHAAAYKHVPMMESYPEEAIKVNVGGTRTLASLACKHEVDKFIMVSTDKAVNPTNVMGATKRVAEEICMAHNNTFDTKFISVRFGNVLGSRGSVVPLFIDQIKKGGPVTITDPKMKRYFMTIPEAVLLVMQAGSMGDGGEVFVLDMGEPVRILDMAEDLIRLHNLKPYVDIPIDFTGIRPGEKLFEELLNAEEGVQETQHLEIFKAICSRRFSIEELETKINELFDILGNGDVQTLKYLLKSIVPTYHFRDESVLSDNGSTKTPDESTVMVE